MRSIALFAVAIVAITCACGGKPSKPPDRPAEPPQGELVLVNVDAAGVAVVGHDPVAYAADKRAVPGAEAHVSTYQGATYRFASAANKQKFDADPAASAPRYGGYCAYAASQNRLSPVEPDQWEILDGQLLLFTNKQFKELFDKDPAGHKAKADANWPALVKQHGKPL